MLDVRLVSPYSSMTTGFPAVSPDATWSLIHWSVHAPRVRVRVVRAVVNVGDRDVRVKVDTRRTRVQVHAAVGVHEALVTHSDQVVRVDALDVLFIPEERTSATSSIQKQQQ